MFDDKGVGPSFNSLIEVLKRQPEINMTILDGDDVRDGALSRFDVFIVPGGSGRREACSLRPVGQAEIKRFVSGGGCYVGICAGCYLASSATDYLGMIPLDIRDRKHWFRGEATLPIEFTQGGADVFGVDHGMANIVYHNGPILDGRPLLEDKQLADSVIPLSFYRGEIVASGGEPGVMNGAPAMVLTRYGKGFVLGMSPHAELTPPLNKIIPHALHWLSEHVSTDILLKH